MPKIQSISVSDDIIQFTDHRGTHTFNASAIPVAQNTIAKVETWLNTVGISALLDNSYQLKVHVNSINPLNVAVITANLDVVIPSNWWDRSNK